MSKRTYNRRSDEEIIGDLQNKIRKIENRIESKKRPDSAVLKELPKIKRNMARFSQLCMDNDRSDISNTVQGFLATLEAQARQETRPV
ncbi:MAG: hypothetical protein GY711_20040 [bacterium]|nr:hypothetical protein [bacterium]